MYMPRMEPPFGKFGASFIVQHRSLPAILSQPFRTESVFVTIPFLKARTLQTSDRPLACVFIISIRLKQSFSRLADPHL
jgi:hypothetical protein